MTGQAPLSDMAGQWINSSDASHMAGYGAGSNMVDAAASGGGMVLPFSYSGATLKPGPVFNFTCYSKSKVANTSPLAEAKVMNAEITSIHAVWPHLVRVSRSTHHSTAWEKDIAPAHCSDSCATKCVASTSARRCPISMPSCGKTR